MNPTVAGGLIGAGGSLLSSIFNLFSQKSANDTNKELAKYNWEQQIAMWERNNEYNTPENQMKRLMAAGLNPNLMYGQGNTGNSTSVPTPQLPHVDPYRMDDPSAAIIRGMQYGRDLELQESQIKNNEALANYNAEKAATESYNRAMKALQKSDLEFDLNLKRELKQTTVDMAFNRLAQAQETLGGLQLDNQFKRDTYDNRVKATALSNRQMVASIDEIRSRTNLNYVQANKVSAEIGLIAEQVVGQQIKNSDSRLEYAYKSQTFQTRVDKVGQELTNLILSGDKSKIESWARKNGITGPLAPLISNVQQLVDRLFDD